MARKTSNWRTNAAALAVVVLPFAASACGGNEERTSNLRAPTPINVSVVIGDNEITASPTKFGAGPIVLITSNQSTASHTLTIEGPRVKQSVGPISPQDTTGEHTLTTDGSQTIQPARLNVGAKRPSAQSKLQQP
jgi:hypothetical protein